MQKRLIGIGLGILVLGYLGIIVLTAYAVPGSRCSEAVTIVGSLSSVDVEPKDVLVGWFRYAWPEDGLGGTVILDAPEATAVTMTDVGECPKGKHVFTHREDGLWEYSTGPVAAGKREFAINALGINIGEFTIRIEERREK